MSIDIPRASVAGIVSVVLVVAGLVLGATVDMAFLVLFLAGAFGPLLLRELGLLKDQDELQRELSLRAGRRAYLVGGLLLGVVTVARTHGSASLDHDATSASSALACLVVTYFLSYLTEFWGPARAASRILIAFGSLWLVFVLLSHGGEGAHGAAALVAELALVVPFFALAFTCRRWPLVSGVLLLLAAAGTFVLFKSWRAVTSDPSALIVAVTFVLPLAFTGLALIGAARADRGAEPA